MKQTAKKILSVFLVVAMVFSLNITAFASPTPPVVPQITINNTNPNHVYGAYLIFDGDYDDGVLSDIVWGSGVDDQIEVDNKTLLEAVKAIEIINGTETETPFASCVDAATVATELSKINDTDAALTKAFADVVGKYLTDEKVISTYNTTNYTITGIKAGYYLVKDTIELKNEQGEIVHDSATRYILQVLGSVSVNPKSEVPTVIKKVLEDTDITKVSTAYQTINENYNDVADWDIGETKSFLISAKLPVKIWDYKTYEIIFHDTLSYGLTFLSQNGYDVYYSIDGGVLTKFAVDNDPVHVVPHNRTEDGTRVTFTADDILENLRKIEGAEGKPVEIVITYEAMLNKDAKIGLVGNPNKVYLEYSNNPYTDGKGKTEEDVVKVFTFEFKGEKVDGTDNSKKLDGAEFNLGKELDDDNNPTKWAQFDKTTGVFKCWVDTIEETDEVTSKIVSGSDGLFKVTGLDADTYYLKETVAPKGYNTLTDLVKIEIKTTATAGQDVQIYNQGGELEIAELVATVAGTTKHYTTTTENPNVTIDFMVANKKGSTLPDTGDTGRAIFYAVGAMGFSVIAIVLIARKRMAKYKK